MGAEVTRDETVLKLQNGQTIVLGPNDVINQDREVEITLTCDNPKCRRSKTNSPTTITVDQKKAAADPLAVPESFSHSIKVVADPYVDQALWFCCAPCAKDYLTYNYVPPKTPRERMEEARKTQDALKAMQAAKKEQPQIWIPD